MKTETITTPDIAKIMEEVHTKTCIAKIDAEVIAAILQDSLKEYYDALDGYYAEEYSNAISSARNRAYDDGFDDGYDIGYGNGHSDGHDEGYDIGYEGGYEIGYDDGQYACGLVARQRSRQP